MNTGRWFCIGLNVELNIGLNVEEGTILNQHNQSRGQRGGSTTGPSPQK